jgi:hypothetical protein
MNHYRTNNFHIDSCQNIQMSIQFARMIGLALLFIVLRVSAAAQSATFQSSSPSASPTTVGTGGNVSISVAVDTSDYGNALPTTSGSTSGSCTASGYTTISWSSLYIAGNVTGYHVTGSSSWTAGDPGTVSFSCTVTVQFNGGDTYTATGSGSFTVVACDGIADAPPTPTITVSDSLETAEWDLTATMSPGGEVTGTITGTGISGVIPVEWRLDCQNGSNDNFPAVPPTIAYVNQEISGNTVTFNYTVINFGWAKDNCECPCQNQSGVENVRADDGTPSNSSWQGVCTD